MNNQKIIEELEKLEILRIFQDKEYSVSAIRHAINSIKKVTVEIKSGKDLRKLVPTIGEKVGKYADLVVSGKGIDEINDLNEKDNKKLTFIHQAMKNYNYPFVDALVAYENGNIVSKEYEDGRIPRKLVKEFEIKFKKLAEKYGVEYKITGSYRRKRKTIGDIDIIIYKKNQDLNLTKIMNKIIKKLPIVKTNMHGEIIFQGTMFLNEDYPEARIDITVVNSSRSLPYALLRTTGNAMLNIHMSKLAKKKGWKLNSTGMTDNEGDAIEAKNEKEIFELLDMDYIKPKDREF